MLSQQERFQTYIHSYGTAFQECGDKEWSMYVAGSILTLELLL